MSFAECQYAECHYAECQYAECQYAECQYAERFGATNTAPGLAGQTPVSSMTVLREFFDVDVVVIFVASVVVVDVKFVPFDAEMAAVLVASLPATLFIPGKQV